MARGISLTVSFVLFLLSASCFAQESSGRNCPDPAKSEAALKAIGFLDNKNSIFVPLKYQSALAVFLEGGGHRNWCQDLYPRSNNIRFTGPLIGDKAFTTHARVRVYYSEEIVNWLESDRQGVIENGAMIVKEMYPAPTSQKGANNKPTGFAVMFRDDTKSHDGWFWFLYYLPGNVTTGGIPFALGQYGNSFCLSCHSSTDSSMGTFAFLGNLENRDVASYVQTAPVYQPRPDDDSANASDGGDPHGNFAALLGAGNGQQKHPSAPVCPKEVPEAECNFLQAAFLVNYILYRPTVEPREVRNSELLSLFREQVSQDIHVPLQADLIPMPPDVVFDHVGQRSDGDSEMFMTSYECQGCHDASYMVNEVTPNMAFDLVGKYLHLTGFAPEYFNVLNLSPYAEWRGSMMAMSGRDPIFRAQLEYEMSTLEKPEDRENVAKFCLSCHSVMGERTSPELAKNPAKVYQNAGLNNPEPTAEQREAARFGALARDGVSCTTCHRIASDNLGTEKSFSAQFKTGPANEIYGPYDDVITQPMGHALGLKPTHGNQITDAGLCGSCHAIEVPVFDGQSQVGHTWEQTTYMEWANSDFADEGSDAQTCQECHMPNMFPNSDQTIATKIANIEDATFPYAPNRANSEKLELTERENYRRHLLVGMNVFGMSMFQQFPGLLGSATYIPGRQLTVVPPKLFAINELLDQAQNRTANIEFTRIRKTDDAVEVSVNVENLTGHKLPSGVGFRRAFIELAVLDSKSDKVWCSGCTDEVGVLVDDNSKRLRSEFATRYEDSQPDYATIDSPDQVQIYENRHVNANGELTTSFIRLVDEKKDNRLLPKGWSKRGPFSEETEPRGLNSPLQAGEDDVTYRIPIEQLPGNGNTSGLTVKVTLNYQSIPPYYLVDRFRILGDETRRGDYTETQKLLYLVLNLNTSPSYLGMQNWKVSLSCDHVILDKTLEAPAGSSGSCLPAREFYTQLPPGAAGP